MPALQSRLWCFTDFAAHAATESKGSDPAKVLQAYMLVLKGSANVCAAQAQIEACPKTKRRHYQGFLVFKRKATLSACQELIPKAHFERCKGTLQDNVDYCSKRASRLCPHQEFGIERIRSQMAPMQRIDRLTFIIHGPCKIGKTEKAAQWIKDHDYDFYEVPLGAKQSSGRWLGPYDGSDVAVIDEFDPAQFGEGQLKAMTDVYTHAMSCSMGGSKQSQMVWSPKVLFLLSNENLAEWAEKVQDEWKRKVCHIDLTDLPADQKWSIPHTVV